MKLIKNNKSLLVLLIIFLIYIILTVVFINPIRNKNSELEDKKSELMILDKEKEYVENFYEENKKSKHEEDIILQIEKSIGSFVNLTSVEKRKDQNGNANLIQVNMSSTLDNILALESKLKELKLENSIETIEIENKISDEINNNIFNCKMVFKVAY